MKRWLVDALAGSEPDMPAEVVLELDLEQVKPHLFRMGEFLESMDVDAHVDLRLNVTDALGAGASNREDVEIHQLWLCVERAGSAASIRLEGEAVVGEDRADYFAHEAPIPFDEVIGFLRDDAPARMDSGECAPSGWARKAMSGRLEALETQVDERLLETVAPASQETAPGSSL